MTVLAMMLLTIATVNAGKLADGFRSIPYGDATVLDKAPDPNCTHSPEPGVAWVCDLKLGGAEVQASYMVEDGVFYAMFLNTEGYTNSAALMDVLQSAYGHGKRKHDFDTSALADRQWRDNDVLGTWSYNQFSVQGKFIALHMKLFGDIKAKEKAAAASAADEL